MDGWSSLATCTRVELELALAGFCGVIGYKLLMGRINTRGLLSDTPASGLPATSRGQAVSRLQLFVLTLGWALVYGVRIIETHTFPPVPRELLLLLSGSHALYLGGKYFAATALINDAKAKGTDE